MCIHVYVYMVQSKIMPCIPVYTCPIIRNRIWLVVLILHLFYFSSSSPEKNIGLCFPWLLCIRLFSFIHVNFYLKSRSVLSLTTWFLSRGGENRFLHLGLDIKVSDLVLALSGRFALALPQALYSACIYQ